MAIMKKKTAPAPASTPTKEAAAAISKPDFETPNEDDSEDTGTSTETPAEVKVSTTTAVAIAPKTAVSTGLKRIESPLEALRDALPVDYDTLFQVQAKVGQFVSKVDNKPLGDTIKVELHSFQSNHVVAPGEDGEEAALLVRYSDDGIHLKDGSGTVADYVRQLQEAGYEKAKATERCVIVCELIDAGKQQDLNEKLIQIDLPPTSKKTFDSYKIQSAFDIRKGRCTVEQTQQITLVCRLASGNINGSKKDWTVVDFNRTKAD